MTFSAHKYAGAGVHLLIAAVLLWALSFLLAAAGWDVPLWLTVIVAYSALSSGSYLGGFADTEDWVGAVILKVFPRWEVYHRCHVTDLYKNPGRYIPAWFFHIFCDSFAHAPKDQVSGLPREPKWWEMNPAWHEHSLIFGLTLWDIHWAYREAALWALGTFMLWAGGALLLSIGHIVIKVMR